MTNTTEEQTIYVDCVNAASLLGLTPWGVRQACQDGQLEHERSGDLILIPLAGVVEYAEARRMERLEELVDAATGKAPSA